MDYILILCYILIFYIIYESYRSTKNYINFMSGMWESDENFNREAGIDAMIIYIGEINGTYFSNANTFALIDPVYIGTMEWKIRVAPWSNTIGINIDYDAEDNKVFGDYIQCDIDIDKGIMRIYNTDGVLFGLLHKNNLLSNYSK